MKKINSIGYGHKIVGLMILFLAAIPLCCGALNTFIHSALLSVMIQISLGIGLITALFFLGLLLTELHQDKRINKYYATVQKMKMSLGNGVYECQFCGSRQVTHGDKSCGACGTRFSMKGGNLQ